MATPTGTVVFTVNSNQIGTATLDANGNYTLTVPATWPSGSYPVLINYLGDSNDPPGSTTGTLTVDADTSTVTLTINPNPVVQGQNVTFSGTVSSS